MSHSRGQIIDEDEAEERFTCGICCGFLENPHRPNVCQHAYCKDCLYNSYNQSKTCPICRKSFEFSKIVPERKLETEFKNSAIKCEYCRSIIRLVNLQKHRVICNQDVTPKYNQAQQTANRFQGLSLSSLNTSGQASSVYSSQSQHPASAANVRQAMQQIVNSTITTSASASTASANSRMGPNRYTFKCPYCNQDNLTLDALRGHCNQFHASGEKEMVCPVCKVMPWGDPNQKSIDFMTHLNFRHKFEYDRYVDFNLDDDEALSKAMRDSLMVR